MSVSDDYSLRKFEYLVVLW